MRESDFATLVLARLQRRLRLLVILVMLGGTGLILAHDAAAISSVTAALLVLAGVSFWLVGSFWAWVFRNPGEQRGR